MLKTLRTQEFSLKGGRYKFDSNGDINLGYDVTMWRWDGKKVRVQDIVAEYHPLYNNFTHTKHSTAPNLQDLKVSFHSAALISLSISRNPQTYTWHYVFTKNIKSDPSNFTGVQTYRGMGNI